MQLADDVRGSELLPALDPHDVHAAVLPPVLKVPSVHAEQPAANE